MTQNVDFEPVPVTILTGFLGAGKTTLLNHILHGNHGLRVAVLVNDFGAVNIDTKLIVGVEGETISLSNGCICCTIRDDLLVAVLQLLARPDRPEYVIIETSGVSDPIAVAMTFLSPEMRPYLRVGSILTVVDAEQARDLTGENALLALDQIGAADIVVLNKVDLITPDEIQNLHRWIRDLVPTARILNASFGNIPLELILGVGMYDTQRLLRPVRDVHVHTTAAHDPDESHHNHDHDNSHHHHHDHTLVFETWLYEDTEPFDLSGLREVLKALPVEIYRVKGIVNLVTSGGRRGILQMTGRRIRLVLGEPWLPNEQPLTQIVVIGSHGHVDAAELQKRFQFALAREVAQRKSFMPDVVEWLRGVFAPSQSR